MKKIITLFLLLSLCEYTFAMNNTLSMESTPFKIPTNNLYMTADVINFAYNCVLMDDDSTIYDVISNTYAKSGSMHVTLHCLQYKTEVVLPLTLQNNFISTPLTSYPVEFSKAAPDHCRTFTTLTVTKEADLMQGYTLKLS